MYLEKINRPDYKTHMPHFARKADGETVMLFCDSKRWEDDGSRLWQARYLNDQGKVKDLIKGKNPGWIECSPTGWEDEHGWHVSYIAGPTMGDEPPVLRLYRMDGPSLSDLSKPVEVIQARTGHVREDRVVWGEVTDNIHVWYDDGREQLIELPGHYIYQVSYQTDKPHNLLISAQPVDGTDQDIFCLRYNLNTGEEEIITCDEMPAYKATINGHLVLFAGRQGGFEARLITSPGKTVMKPSRKIR